MSVLSPYPDPLHYPVRLLPRIPYRQAFSCAATSRQAVVRRVNGGWLPALIRFDDGFCEQRFDHEGHLLLFGSVAGAIEFFARHGETTVLVDLVPRSGSGDRVSDE